MRGAAGGAAGFGAGLVLFWAAAWLLGVVWPPGAGLEAARGAGLISFTVLAGYDEAQEARVWLLGCLLVPAAAWLGARRGGRRIEAPTLPPSRGAWIGVGIVVAVAGVVGLRLLGASRWGSFGLLAEEGVYLGAVQVLRGGGRLYADVEFPYGPLLLLPMDLGLRLLGDTVAHARLVVLAGHLLGVVAMAAIPRLLLGPGRGDRAALGVALGMVWVAPLMLPTLNSVALRPALAFLPAALAWAGRRDGRAAVAAGVAAAVALGTSFEVGAAALGGVGAVLLGFRGAATRAAVGFGAAMALVLVVPLANGALPALVEQAGRMLSLPAMGYQALPYPDLLGVFVDGSGARGSYGAATSAAAFWAATPPLLIWAGLAVAAARQGRGPLADPLWAVALPAAVLFRAALGRSDTYHLWFYGAPAAVLLAVLLADRAEPLHRRAGSAAAAALLALGVAAQTVDARSAVEFPAAEELRLGTAAGIADPLATRKAAVDRLGVLTTERLARQLEAVVPVLEPLQGGVLVHPSEATWYFLSGQTPPTRYLWAYDAATPALRQEELAELTESPPRWVLRATDTFPLDWIPLDQLVPEYESWIDANYHPVRALPGAELWERK